jgi:hypothetical protein
LNLVLYRHFGLSLTFKTDGSPLTRLKTACKVPAVFQRFLIRSIQPVPKILTLRLWAFRLLRFSYSKTRFSEAFYVSFVFTPSIRYDLQVKIRRTTRTWRFAKKRPRRLLSFQPTSLRLVRRFLVIRSVCQDGKYGTSFVK